MTERHKNPMLTHPDFRRKQRDRFALATLGSGLLGKLDPADAIKAMFDVAEQMMIESERRYDKDRERLERNNG